MPLTANIQWSWLIEFKPDPESHGKCRRPRARSSSRPSVLRGRGTPLGPLLAQALAPGLRRRLSRRLTPPGLPLERAISLNSLAAEPLSLQPVSPPGLRLERALALRRRPTPSGPLPERNIDLTSPAADASGPAA